MLESLRNQKSPLKALFRQNYLKWLCFTAKRGFKEYWSSKWVPKTYYIILYVKIHIWDKNNFARVTLETKKPFKGSVLGTTCQKDIIFARSDFLRLFGAQNESLRLITIQFMFKYLYRIRTTMLESLQSHQSPLKARFR